MSLTDKQMTERRKLLQQIIRFGGIGVLATLTHFVVLTVSVEALSIVPTLANGAAFCVAVFVTYFGQSYLVFDDKEHSLIKSIRFISSALLGLTLNVMTMYMITQIFSAHYLIGFFVATTIVPAINFTINKLWVFENRSSEPSPD